MGKKSPDGPTLPEAIQRSLWDDAPDNGSSSSTDPKVEAEAEVDVEVTDHPDSNEATPAATNDETPVRQPSERRGFRGESSVRVILGSGSLQLEESLLAEVARLDQELRGGSELPRFEAAGPIRIVVPSGSLRSHLLGALARRFQRPLLGVLCQTHHSLARDLLDRAGSETATSGDLTALLARRYAQKESALSRRLGHLHDGLGAVVGTVRDFIDAGLDPTHVEALLDLLAAEGSSIASYAEVERAGAVLRVAARTLAGHEEIGVLPASGTVQRATEYIKNNGPDAIPTRSVLVYGYADATGIATEFLRTLLSVSGGALFIDRPEDPAESGNVDRGFRISERFLERVAPAQSFVEPTRPAEPGHQKNDLESEITAFRALGTDAECREVANRCRTLLDEGTKPEAIGVVARNLSAYSVPLRRHFRRLGVPFSGIGPHGPPEPFARRAEGFLELLRDQGRVKLDRWFEMVDQDALAAPRADLKLALAAAGQTRLEDLIQLDITRLAHGRSGLPLPIRLGILEDVGAEETRSRATRRQLPKEALREEQGRARQALARLEESAPLSSWLESVPLILGEEGLAWPPSEIGRIGGAIGQAIEQLPRELTLRHSEFSILVERTIRETADRSLGGAGGGVQILDVTESRGRTFEELFLVGMNRGVFPRTVQADPLLPDSIREQIARSGHGLLPDLPIKRAGFDEERYLFAQLLGASRGVTLSWLETDAEGRPSPPSPLVERLEWSHRLDGPVELFSEPYARATDALRTGWERGVEVALHADRSSLAELLPSLFPSGANDSAGDGGRWASARIAILAEQAPTPGTTAWNDLGPYFGFVGPAAPDDPRRTRDVFVTTLERLARCPWNAFLEKVLSLESYPDPFDVLPRVDPLRIGALVHRVLERVVLRTWRDQPEETRPFLSLPSWNRTPEERAAELEALAASPGVRVDWSVVPIDEEIRAAADELVRDLGTPVPGYAAALARAGRPFVDVAIRLDRASSRPAVGIEVIGQVEVPLPEGEGTGLHFRADRVEQSESGLRWIDFKTGKPFSDAKTASTRQRHLHDRIRKGETLQAAAYAHSRGGSDSGSYLFLRPDQPADDAERQVELRADDDDVAALFQTSVERLAGAWYAGTFFPRLSEPSVNRTPQACERCDVAEACLQGDSGSRIRMRRWFNEGEEGDRPGSIQAGSDRAAALDELWFSGKAPKGEASGRRRR